MDIIGVIDYMRGTINERMHKTEEVREREDNKGIYAWPWKWSRV